MTTLDLVVNVLHINTMTTANLKLSQHQESVLGILMHAERPMSAYTVLDKLKAAGVKSPPIVYRALDKLVSLGLIHRLASLNAYVACCQHSESKCGHKHHHGHDQNHVSQFAICTSCGDVKELESAEISKIVKKASSLFLMDIEKSVFEVSGTCRSCAQADV